MTRLRSAHDELVASLSASLTGVQQELRKQQAHTMGLELELSIHAHTLIDQAHAWGLWVTMSALRGSTKERCSNTSAHVHNDINRCLQTDDAGWLRVCGSVAVLTAANQQQRVREGKPGVEFRSSGGGGTGGKACRSAQCSAEQVKTY